MKLLALIPIPLLLAACVAVKEKEDNNIPALPTLASQIKTGMDANQAGKILSPYKPFVEFSTQDNARSIWQINQRRIDPKNKAIDANKLTLTFDDQGHVTNSALDYCLLPDLEIPQGRSPATHCYQKQLFPFDKQLTYDAIKRLLLISNYQVDHSDAASELISATGVHPVEGDADKIMFIKLTIIFSTKGDATEVVMSATFNLSEKQSKWVQAGFAGVTLPVPLPFQHTEEWIESGIVTPKFYMDFYDALANLISREYQPYQTPQPKPSFAATPAQPPATAPKLPEANSTPAAPALQGDQPIDSQTPTNPEAEPSAPSDAVPIDSATPPPDNGPNAVDEPANPDEGPIDKKQKQKKKTKSKTKGKHAPATQPEGAPQENDDFSQLGDKPIDSR